MIGRVAALAISLAALLAIAGAPGCGDEATRGEELVDPGVLDLHEKSGASTDDPIEPLPTSVPFDAKKAAIGEMLFDDPIVSPDGQLTCTTCHMLEKGGEDGRNKSDIPNHSPAVMNTPTVFNLAFNFRYQWAGTYDELTTQLKIPIESPRVMATKFDDIVTRLKTSPKYRKAFSEVFEAGITADTFEAVMVEFERSLVTPNCRFDRWLRGESDALTTDELAGYALFKSHGCISCHQGINIGGNMFQKLGVMREFFEERGEIGDADLGRYNVTKKESDRHVFRVPSLRNVAVTGPYFHDGSVATLEDAVQVMSRYQLGRPLSAEQARLLVAFLGTLTGEYRGKPLE